MTTINSLNTSQYYSLLGQAQSGSTKDGSASSASILSSLNSSSSTATNLNDEVAASGAYNLTLSAQAQAYLSGLNSGESTSTPTEGVRLSTQQFEQVKDIIAKYEDAPFTQETFNQIQDDLEAAGLSGNQLAVQQQMNNFNPTATLLSALNGGEASTSFTTPSAVMANVQSMSENYMTKIESLWRSMSNTAPAE